MRGRLTRREIANAGDRDRAASRARLGRRLAPWAIMFGALLLSARAKAQFSQDGPKLVGSGGTSPDQQGAFVALSADGTTAIVGGDTRDRAPMPAWAWTRTAGVWAQQGPLIGTNATIVNPNTSIYSSGPVAVSADGNTALVANANDNGIGAVWVWVRVGGIWVQQGQKLVSASGGYEQQGSVIALSADGNTALVVGNSLDKVVTWIWTRSGGVWSRQAAPVAFPPFPGGNGGVLAISADLSSAAVSSWFGGGPTMSIWTRSGSSWTRQSDYLVNYDDSGSAVSVSSAALSVDGTTAIFGCSYDGKFVGAAWVWARNASGVWVRQGNKLVGAGAEGGSGQGAYVALSADGNTAFVGGPYDHASLGAAWIWRRTADAWLQQGDKLISGDYRGGFGGPVALSADGRTALVGQSGIILVGGAWAFRDASAPAGCPGSTSTGNTLPLVGGRFVATLSYTGYSASVSGLGTAWKLSDTVGYFGTADSTAADVTVKMVNFCALNGSWSVYIGGTTDVHTVVQITDTKTGRVSSPFVNALGHDFQLMKAEVFSCP